MAKAEKGYGNEVNVSFFAPTSSNKENRNCFFRKMFYHDTATYTDLEFR